MSIFKKMLASIGIGAAKVDTQLQESVTYPGGTLTGEVYAFGGDIAQDIEQIYLYVATKYERESESSDETYYEECKLVKYRVSSGFVLQPQEEKVIPFSLQIPDRTPLTLGKQEVYIRTGLDVAMAVNPKDWDYLSIQPHPLMQLVLNALDAIDFRLYKSDCEYNPRMGREYPFVQELEFKPTGKYRGQLDELEVIFYLEGDRLEVLLEIDRKAKGFKGWVAEAFDADESYASFYLSSYDLHRPLQESVDRIEDIIQRRIN